MTPHKFDPTPPPLLFSQDYHFINTFIQDFTKLPTPYPYFSRLSTARGSSTGLVTVGLTNVKACKFVLFTEGIPEVEISTY